MTADDMPMSSNDATTVSSAITSLNNKGVCTRLWGIGKSSQGDNLTMSESVENFLFIIVEAVTNTDLNTIVLSTMNYQNAYEIFITGSNSTGQQTYPLTYNSTLKFKFTSATTLSHTATYYNNVNFTAGIRAVYGVIRK
jgi:hypothetical protein